MFMLLTQAFQDKLQRLSTGGQLAYVETDYFGGVGGQGAVVYRDGHEVLPRTWGKAGVINGALRLLGVKRKLLADRFTVIGFGQVRSNDDILNLIQREC